MNWSELLPEEMLDLSFKLADHAAKERENGKNIFPPQDQIFRALNLTKPENVKVCIVGQDPYHTPGQANGLAFSIAAGHPLQPSLVNIFKELENDMGISRPATGDLTPWAEKGVLLLNTTLTVEQGKANSHSGWGWDRFTFSVLKSATKLPQPIVFCLWGANAQKMLKDLFSCAAIWEEEKHIARENLIKKSYIISSHPSPFSANRTCGGAPAFIGSKPFSTVNRLLQDMGGEPIDWRL